MDGIWGLFPMGGPWMTFALYEHFAFTGDLTYPVSYTHLQMENIRVTNNLFRLSGFGWGYQRPDKGGAAHIKSWDHYNKAINFVIDGNVFDRSRNHLLSLEAKRKGWLPILGKNKYIPVSYTHLDVYKRQLGRSVLPTKRGR